MERALGPEAEALLRALGEECPVSIRINPLKPVAMAGEPVPWCARGRYLAERPVFTLDPLLHAGAYYVQEASSMLLEQAIARTDVRSRDILAMDLCAAPGGKTSHLAALLTPGSLIIANEVNPARRDVLQENLWKHGFSNTLVTGTPTAELPRLPGAFDLIVVDAPCSGEGMFRKDAYALEQWNERLVASCAFSQRGILEHAWQALRPGGWLIYSTCTWERAENEDQVIHLQEAGALWIPLTLDPTWGVETTDAGHRCYPHRVRGEGFFLALLQKPGSAPERTMSTSGGEPIPEIAAWMAAPEALELSASAEMIHAAPARWSGELERLRAILKFNTPGIPVAERKGDRWRPHPALALNSLLRADSFPAIDLDRHQALAFLRGETQGPYPSNAAASSGVLLVRYAGCPLGWMHAAGDRWNNGWPKPWRIRMR